MTQVFIGIDPGGSGGIAALDEAGLVRLACKIPETAHEIVAALRLAHYEPPSPGTTCGFLLSARAALEEVQASPQMGVVSAFTFGRGFGTLEGILAAVEMPFERVRPRKWQEALGCRLPGGKGFGERDSGAAKNLTKRRAQELFPHAKVTHAIADALLLAEYLRRLEVRV